MASLRKRPSAPSRRSSGRRGLRSSRASPLPYRSPSRLEGRRETTRQREASARANHSRIFRSHSLPSKSSPRNCHRTTTFQNILSDRHRRRRNGCGDDTMPAQRGARRERRAPGKGYADFFCHRRRLPRSRRRRRLRPSAPRRRRRPAPRSARPAGLVHGLAELHRSLRQRVGLGLDRLGVVAVRARLQAAMAALDRRLVGGRDLVAIVRQRLLGRMDQRLALVPGLDQRRGASCPRRRGLRRP